MISGIQAFNGRILRAKQSGKSLHRSAESSLGERLRKKIFEKTGWYKGTSKTHKNPTKKIKKRKIQNFNFSAPKKIKSVLFVPRTGSSKLTKMLREEELKLTEITKYRVKIQEMNGTQIRRIFCQKNPFKGLPCSRPLCMVCKGEGNGECRRRSVTYMTTCDLCRANNAAAGVQDTAENVAAYWGEASRSAAERSAEHLQDYRAKNEDSHIFKHQQIEHPDQEVTFTMKVLRKHKSAFSRMVEESTLITLNQNSSKILNSKSGFNRSQIPRLTVSMGENVVVDTIRTNEYTNVQVEDLITENNRRQLKNCGREDRGDDLNIQIPHHPPKRRKCQFTKRNSSNDSSVPKKDESIVLSTVTKSEQIDTKLDIIDSKSSESSNRNLKFFTIFSKQRNGDTHLSSKARTSIQSKRKSRTPGRNIKINPLPPLIASHFKPASNKSEISNEPGDEDRGGERSEGSSVHSADAVVTRPRPHG